MALRELDDGWAGDDLADLVAFFELEPSEIPVHQVVTARCADCAGQVFQLETDESASCARRTCVGCDRLTYMLDSAQWWPTLDEEAEARYVVECACGGDEFETAVGFTFYQDTPDLDVRWVSLAVRCTADGALGYYLDRKVGYGPSHHLVEQV